MSDAEDVAAIQTFLKNTSTQTSAAVASCMTLDDETRTAWDGLASRILAYVSQDAAPLPLGQALRGELNAFMATLKAKGCGDVAQEAATAPPPVMAPPPVGTPNPLLKFFEHPLVPVLIIAAVLIYADRKLR
jgi:hypothetical protein